MAFDRLRTAPAARLGAILLICDDTETEAEFVTLFRGQGFDLLQIDPEAVEPTDVGTDIDLVIYDERKSPGRAIGFCRASAVHGGAPIIVLSDQPDAVSQIVALEVGADEIVSTPVDGRLLLARVRAILRRAHRTPARAASSARWTVDPLTRIATTPQGETVDLARHQVRLMKLFLDNAGTVLTPEAVAERDPELRMEPAAFRTAISRLRRRLDRAGAPDFIRVVRGSGYLHPRPCE